MKNLNYIGHNTPKSFYAMVCLLVSFAYEKRFSRLDFSYRHDSDSFKFEIKNGEDEYAALYFFVSKHTDTVKINLQNEKKVLALAKGEGLFSAISELLNQKTLDELELLKEQKACMALVDVFYRYMKIMSKVEDENPFQAMLKIPFDGKEREDEGQIIFDEKNIQFKTFLDDRTGYIFVEFLTDSLDINNSSAVVDGHVRCFLVNVSSWLGGMLPKSKLNFVRNAMNHALKKISDDLDETSSLLISTEATLEWF